MVHVRAKSEGADKAPLYCDHRLFPVKNGIVFPGFVRRHVRIRRKVEGLRFGRHHHGPQRRQKLNLPPDLRLQPLHVVIVFRGRDFPEIFFQNNEASVL